MKMNYPQRNRNRSSLMKPALFLGAIFLFGFIIFSLLDGVIISAVSPLWRSEGAASTKLTFFTDFFRFKSSLISENNLLKERVGALELEITSRFSMPEGEETLAELLGRRAEMGGVVATALVVPPQTPYDTIVIDAGSDDGVANGNSVRMPEGPLLGTISETYSGSAKVRLLSTPGEKTAAILERHSVPVTLEGAGGGNFRIIMPRETEVEVGDRILSADITSSLLAVVGEVHMEPTDSFKDVFAKSPVNIFSLHYLLVRP